MAFTDDELARMMLAALTEPNLPVTGQLVRLVGAAEAVELIRNPELPLPAQVNASAGARWRTDAFARYRDSLADELQLQTEQHQMRLLTPHGFHWPVALRDLGDHMPVALWAQGDPDLLTASTTSYLTIAGARAATGYGVHVTEMLVDPLVAQGRIIVAGGAYGIDAAAHRSALSTREASTIAVLPAGVDRPYPAAHETMFRRITESGGLLISELPPATTPTKWRFMARSRLLAALGGVTVITEAGARSSALVVASYATEIGRHVGAVPGPITSASSAGCHRLLREDMAEVVTRPADIESMLDPHPTSLGPAYQRAARRAGIGPSPPQRTLAL